MEGHRLVFSSTPLARSGGAAQDGNIQQTRVQGLGFSRRPVWLLKPREDRSRRSRKPEFRGAMWGLAIILMEL